MNDIAFVTAADPVSSQRVSDETLLADAPSAAAIIQLADQDRPAAAKRWRWPIPVAGVGLLAGAAIAATTLASSTPATISNMVRCYSVGGLTTNVRQYTDTAMASAPGHRATDVSASATAAIGACSGLWQTGFIRPGIIGAPAGYPNGRYPVPKLVACVLQDGRAAVLPGNAQTCRHLGLPALAPKTDR